MQIKCPCCFSDFDLELTNKGVRYKVLENKHKARQTAFKARPMEIDPDERLTPKEVEDRYKLTRTWQKFERWRTSNNIPGNLRIPFEKVGKKVLYRKLDLDLWLSNLQSVP